MPVMLSAASAFSNADWLCAVLAHVPGVDPHQGGETVEPFGLFPVARARFPLAHAVSRNTALTPCPLPAVSRTPTCAEARNFLETLAMPLVLRGVPEGHPVTAALLDAATHVKVLARWERAAIDVTGSFDTWLMENFDHKRRKELKRLKTRLSEQGVIGLDELRPGAALEPHMEAFLAIESSGWKGRRGTAISSDPAAAKGLSAGLAAMHLKDRVRFWTLRLDGKPIASLFALVEGGQAVLGKIGYDETHWKYSPGVLLVMEATRSLFAEPGIQQADGNAIPGHPMIDRIWRDRLACINVVVAGPTTRSAHFQSVAHFHGAKDAVRGTAKKFYLQISGRKAS